MTDRRVSLSMSGTLNVAQALMRYLATSFRRGEKGGGAVQDRAELCRLCHRLLRQEPLWTCLPVEALSEQDWREASALLPLATKSSIRAVQTLAGFRRYIGGGRRGECRDSGYLSRRGGRRYPLAPEQWWRLLATARREEHLPCAPALGLMLWGGVTENEVERLCWRHILWEKRMLIVPGKTGTGAAEGGERETPLQPILCKWLLHHSLFRDAEGPVVPRSWKRRWRLLRMAAGFHSWVPEVLQLTYAACHACFFRDIPGLMKELGESGRRLFPNGAASFPSVPEEWGRFFWKGHL